MQNVQKKINFTITIFKISKKKKSKFNNICNTSNIIFNKNTSIVIHNNKNSI